MNRVAPEENGTENINKEEDIDLPYKPALMVDKKPEKKQTKGERLHNAPILQVNEVDVKKAKEEEESLKSKMIYYFTMIWLSSSHFVVAYNQLLFATFLNTIANEHNYKWKGTKFTMNQAFVQSFYFLGLCLACFTFQFYSKFSQVKLYGVFQGLVIIFSIVSILPHEIF
jgi:hypothetical protein